MKQHSQSGYIKIKTRDTFWFGLQIFPPDLAYCGWHTQVRGTVLSVLYVLLKMYVTSSIKSIQSIKPFILEFFWHCHIEYPESLEQNHLFPKCNFVVLRRRWFRLSPASFAFTICGHVSNWKDETQLYHGWEYLSTLCSIPQSSIIISQLV